MIKQVKTGWQVDIKPNGRAGRRVRKTFKLKSEAIAWERHIQAQAQNDNNYIVQKKDLRKLSDLCKLWYELHGKELKAGKDTFSRLLTLCSAMGDPHAINFNAEMFANYRNKRIESGITANNMNREHPYLRAVFNELIRINNWTRENPLAKLRQFKIDEKELNYLTSDQIDILLDNMQNNKDLLLPTSSLLFK